MKDKIIEQLREYAKAISEELKSSNDEFRKAFNLFTLFGNYDATAQLLFEYDDGLEIFEQISNEYSETLAAAENFGETVYNKCNNAINSISREFFNSRYAKHCDKIKEYAGSANLPGAQRIFGRICELCAIAHCVGLLTDKEKSAHLKHAEDCFNNSL